MDKPLTMRIIRHFLSIIFFLFIQPQGISGSWWLLSQLQVSSLGSQLLCNNIPGLVRRQRDLCQRSPDLLQSVSRGARIGVRECQHQFSRHRWNCSTIDKGSSVFGKVMLKAGSREAAFLYAISSAGVVHAVTRSCSKGEIRNCACDPNKRGVSQDSQGDFTWGGCSEYVSYGIKFSRKFVDARERRQRDARALMNLHNNRAGRRAVQKHMKMECKCHGVSGSCASRTCWLALKEFREVGRYLKKRYDIAVQTAMNQPGQLVPVQTQKGVSRNDLVYFEPSPDYCVTNTDTGSWGTAGRECNKTSKGTDGCDIMCCGRGYDTKRVLVTTKCRCKFHWCCYVKCDECREWKDIHTCKAATEN